MKRADWCYISGAVAAAETRLLSSEELADLLRSGTPEGLVGRLRQNAIYRNVDSEGDAEGLSGQIERSVVEALREIGRTSPDAGAAELILSPYDHQQVRNYIKSKVRGHAFQESAYSEVNEEELSAAWEDAFHAPARWASVCRSVKHALEGGGDEDVVIDLMVDRAELLDLLGLARGLESKFLETCYGEYTAAKGKLAVVRGRLAGLGAEPLETLGAELVAEGELTELVEFPLERLGHALGIERGTEEISEGLSRYAQEIDNRMTEHAHEARGYAFGPEVVWGYAWGLWMECLNLKLISESRLLGAPTEMTQWRLRKSHV